MNSNLVNSTVRSIYVVTIICMMTLLLLLNKAFAMDETPDYDDSLDLAPQASDAELDQLRGGFALPNGMNVDFSFDRVVSLNGVVTLSSTFQFPNDISVLQNGLHNQVQQLNFPMMGSVIQNSLDNQFIQAVNTINIELTNLHNIAVNHDGAMFNNLILPNL